MSLIRCEHCGHKMKVKDFQVVNACPACGRSAAGDFVSKGRFAFSLTTAISVVMATGLVLLVNFQGQWVNASWTKLNKIKDANGEIIRERIHMDGVAVAYGWPYPVTGDSFFPAVCTDVVLGLVFVLIVGLISEKLVRASRSTAKAKRD